MRSSKISSIGRDSRTLRIDGQFLAQTLTGAATTQYTSKVFVASRSLAGRNAGNKFRAHLIRAIEVVPTYDPSVGAAVYDDILEVQIRRNDKGGALFDSLLVGEIDKSVLMFQTRLNYAVGVDAGAGLGAFPPQRGYYYQMPGDDGLIAVRPYYLDAISTHVISSGNLSSVVSVFVYYKEVFLEESEYQRILNWSTAEASLRES